MAINKTDLAKAINEALAVTDKDGKPIETTAEMETYADAIITTITTSGVTLPLVQGTAPGGPGPVNDLQGSNGTYLPPLAPTTWLGVMTGGFSSSNPADLATEATSSTAYLMGSTQIAFSVGTMEGTSTATPPSNPGNLVFISGTGGKMSGLDGASWASFSTPPGGDPSVAQKVYQAIVDYLQENAEVIFPAGTVNGVFPSPGAPLTGGVGIGGMVN